MPMNGGMREDPVVLGPTEEVPGRTFTAVGQIERDRLILHGMLTDVIGVLLEADLGQRTVVPHEKLVWQVSDRTHRLLVCDEGRLRFHSRLCVVGFFGERHRNMDPSPLEDANTAIVAAFVDHPGILSYSSVEFGRGKWANLVLHDDPSDRDYWRGNPLHTEAVRVLSPIHYRNVRIYNGELTASLTDSPAITLQRTKYFDYTGSKSWRAERTLVG